MLNFKIRIFKRFDGKWGGIDKNGNWNGMISNLMSGEADIALALAMCCGRTEVADFLWTIEHSVEVFAIKGQNISLKKPVWVNFGTMSFTFWRSDTLNDAL